MTTRRQEILDVFNKLVSRYGISKTSMQDIAKEMGISIGTIYNDFANKEDLILAFWRTAEDQLKLHLDSLAGRKLPPEQLLRVVMLEHIRIINEQLRCNRGIYELMSESTISYIGKIIIGRRGIVQQQLVKRVEAIFRAGVANGDFEITADIATTAIRFVEAFTEYHAPPLVLSRELETVLKDADSMFDFVIRAVKKH